MTFSLQPFFEADLATQTHVITALLALVSGGIIFARRKGTSLHKSIGRFWFGMMAIVALSSFFIHGLRTIGPFSGLHFLSIWTLAVLVIAVWAIRRGNVRAHKFSLIGLYVGGLIFTGLLTLSQGLLMHRIFFGENGAAFLPTPSQLPGGPVLFPFFIAVGIVFVIAVWAWRSPQQGAR